MVTIILLACNPSCLRLHLFVRVCMCVCVCLCVFVCVCVIVCTCAWVVVSAWLCLCVRRVCHVYCTVLYCTVCERIGTGFHCSVMDRWAAATPNPPVARRYPPSSKIYWPILGIPVPSCRKKSDLKKDTEFSQLWSVPQKGEKPNLLVDTRQVEIVRLS